MKEAKVYLEQTQFDYEQKSPLEPEEIVRLVCIGF